MKSFSAVVVAALVSVAQAQQNCDGSGTCTSSSVVAAGTSTDANGIPIVASSTVRNTLVSSSVHPVLTTEVSSSVNTNVVYRTSVVPFVTNKMTYLSTQVVPYVRTNSMLETPYYFTTNSVGSTYVASSVANAAQTGGNNNNNNNNNNNSPSSSTKSPNNAATAVPAVAAGLAGVAAFLL